MNSKSSYSPETPKLGQNFFYLCDLHLWPLTWTFCMEITFVNGNNLWKIDGDTTCTMGGALFKRCQTDGQDRKTDRSDLRAAWPQLKIVLGTIFVQKPMIYKNYKNLKEPFSPKFNVNITACINHFHTQWAIDNMSFLYLKIPRTFQKWLNWFRCLYSKYTQTRQNIITCLLIIVSNMKIVHPEQRML